MNIGFSAMILFMIVHAALALWVVNVLVAANLRLILFIYIPIVFGIAFLMVISYKDLLGYPTDTNINKTAAVFAYKIDKEEYIYLWTVDTTNMNLPPRVYTIPYSKDKAKSLKDHNEKFRRGIVLNIKDKKTNDKKGNGTNMISAEDAEFYELSPAEISPKM